MKRIVNALGRPSSGKRAYATFVLCMMTALNLPAQPLTTICDFGGAAGQAPEAALVQGIDGNLYGTTSAGGANNGGTFFKMTPGGALTTLYNFGSPNGVSPYGALVQAANGDFYGTTLYGGAHGYGTVFKITPSGALTTLYSFCSQIGCTDGGYPYAGLVQGANGDFYGTTTMGGEGTDGEITGIGTIFKITPSGSFSTLYNFCSQSGCTDGQVPYAGLVQAANGNLYGTTEYGGANGSGTVFEITPGGTLTTLYSFCPVSGCPDGAIPWAGLVQANNGDFYGTTYQAGANGLGTVFRITPGGVLTTIYSFCSEISCADGAEPEAALVAATNGDFYGTTAHGGSAPQNGLGTAFKITPGGTLTTLYTFRLQDDRCLHGCYPAGLVQDTNGDLYGTTTDGGEYGAPYGYGTVFSLSVGLGPFVQPRPTSGEVGTVVRILGSGLTGATGVSFNGVAAVFDVVSGSEITATVPTGATSGKIEVVTPSGTLSSNTSFRVLP